MADTFDVLRLVQIITAIAITILVSYVSTAILSGLLKRRSFPVETGKRIIRITRYGIIAAGTILIIIFLASDIVTTLIGLGFLGIAIGFGLASVINNFVAGISVMISKSVVEGDDVKVGFFEGKITKITITKTVLETADGEIVYVPNSYFMSNPVSRKKHVGPTAHKHDIEHEGVV
jgi:small-conductance mechanosensitive channel